VNFQQADDDGEVAVSLIIALIVENPAAQMKLLRRLLVSYKTRKRWTCWPRQQSNWPPVSGKRSLSLLLCSGFITY
jgi:hypothetical protein